MYDFNLLIKHPPKSLNKVLATINSFHLRKRTSDSVVALKAECMM